MSEVKQATRKIAIITTEDNYSSNFDDDYKIVATSISDWTEVTEAEYQLLLKFGVQRYKFKVIERPSDEESFVKKTVAQYMIEAEKEAKQVAAQREKERKRKEDAAAKREAKRKQLELNQLRKLAEKYGAPIDL